MKTLLVLNDAPYGSERSYHALRLAHALLKGGDEVRLFLVGDAAVGAKAGQKVAPGYYNVADMLTMVFRAGGLISVCGTCLEARGIADGELVEGASRGSMDVLSDWTRWSDKTIVF